METTPYSLLIRLCDPDRQENSKPDWEKDWRRFNDLFTPLIRYLARRMGLQSHDADDLVQDVLSTLQMKLPTYDRTRGKGFRSWLCAIVGNRGRDFLRRARLPNAGDAALADVAVSDGVAELSEAEYRQHVIGRAFQLVQSDFNQQTRKAFNLLVMESKSVEATAAELGMTPAAVYAAKSRVLRRLRQELAGLLD